MVFFPNSVACPKGFSVALFVFSFSIRVKCFFPRRRFFSRLPSILILLRWCAVPHLFCNLTFASVFVLARPKKIAEKRRFVVLPPNFKPGTSPRVFFLLVSLKVRWFCVNLSPPSLFFPLCN